MSPTEIKSGEVSKRSNAETSTRTRTRALKSAANDPFFEAAVNAAKTRAYKAAVSAGLSPS